MEYFYGHIHVSAPEEIHEQVDRLLRDEIRRHTQVAAVDLELLEVPRAVYAAIVGQSEDGFLLAADWRKVLEGAKDVDRSPYTVVGLTGEGHALRLARLRSLVTDVELVSGGTGFAILERSDPIVNVCGDGREFRVEVEFADADQARLYLQGADASIVEVREVAVKVTSLRSSQSAPEVEEVKEMAMSLPRQKVHYWELERDLPLGREVLLDSEAGEGEAVRLLVARVRKLR